MKKAFLRCLACLLLAGCGAPSETVTPTDSWPDSALAETNEAAAESPPEPWLCRRQNSQLKLHRLVGFTYRLSPYS